MALLFVRVALLLATLLPPLAVVGASEPWSAAARSGSAEDAERAADTKCATSHERHGVDLWKEPQPTLAHGLVQTKVAQSITLLPRHLGDEEAEDEEDEGAQEPQPSLGTGLVQAKVTKKTTIVLPEDGRGSPPDSLTAAAAAAVTPLQLPVAAGNPTLQQQQPPRAGVTEEALRRVKLQIAGSSAPISLREVRADVNHGWEQITIVNHDDSIGVSVAKVAGLVLLVALGIFLCVQCFLTGGSRGSSWEEEERSHGFSVGRLVVAKETFRSDSQDADEIWKGEQGEIQKIDHEGDVLIRFHNKSTSQWVYARRVPHLLATLDSRAHVITT